MRTLNRAYLVNFQSREIIWSRDWKWTNSSEVGWSKTLLTDRLCAWLQMQEDNATEDDDYKKDPKGRCRLRFRMLDSKSGREVVNRKFWPFDGGGRERVGWGKGVVVGWWIVCRRLSLKEKRCALIGV